MKYDIIAGKSSIYGKTHHGKESLPDPAER